MHLQEVVFASTATSASSSGPGALHIHDIQTGSSLVSFKQSNAAPHCTAFVESQNGQGGFIMAAQQDKAIMNVYNFQKDQMALKTILPEKLTCISVDPRGEFCAGGTSQGRIYLWEVASGILYNSWDAHYRRVAVVKFTFDSAAIISGSEDSGVSVWSVSRLLDDDLQNELPMPYCTLSDHTLPVTDIICGVGRFPTCRLLTSSVDHSVKLWDLATKALLTTFQFPKPITCLAWDVAERMFFAGSDDGSIHQMNLFRHRKDNNSSGVLVTEAIGGAGLSDIVRVDHTAASAGGKRLISVGQPITCLTISLTSTLLLVGTVAGHIHIYDIPSHQLLRTINVHSGLTITHLATMLKPPDLIGHSSVSMSAADAKDSTPVKPVAPFQRMRDLKARQVHEVAMLIPVQDRTPTADPLTYSPAEMLEDHAYFVQPSMSESKSVDGVSLQAKVSNLEDEVARLKDQLAKAKNVNDTMWETVVQRVMTEKKSKHNGMDVDVTE